MSIEFYKELEGPKKVERLFFRGPNGQTGHADEFMLNLHKDEYAKYLASLEVPKEDEGEGKKGKKEE